MKYSTAILRFASYFYLFLSIALVAAPFIIPTADQAGMIFLSVMGLVFGFGIYKVRLALLENKYWGWVAGIIIFGMMCLSLFLPLGVVGLFELLKKDTRRRFAQMDEAYNV